MNLFIKKIYFKQFIFSSILIIATLFLNVAIKSYMEFCDIKKGLELPDYIMLQYSIIDYNNQNQKKISCLNEYVDFVNKSSFDNGFKETLLNNISLDINEDTIIIYKENSSTFFNTLYLKLFDLECNNIDGHYFEFASFRNILRYDDTIVSGVSKKFEIKHQIDSIIEKVTNDFVRNNKNYYVYDEVFQLQLKYDHKFNMFISNDYISSDYYQQLFLLNVKTSLDSILKANEVSLLIKKIGIPRYLPVPPPNFIVK